MKGTVVAPTAHRRARRFRRGLVAVVVLALAARLLAVADTPGFRPATDAGDFDRHAVSLATHGTYPSSVLTLAGGPSAFRPPLFPLFLAAVYKMRGVGSPAARWQAGRVAEAVLGSVAVALICLIALQLWEPAVALLAGALAAIYPPLVLVGSSLLSESLYIPLVLAAVLAALRHRGSDHRWRWAVLSGFLIGLAALTRSNGAILVLPLCVLVWQERPRLSRRALRGPAIIAAIAALTLVPWTVRNALVMHAFVPISTQTGYALAGTYNSSARAETTYPALWISPWNVPSVRSIFVAHRTLGEAGISAALRQRATSYALDHPGYVLEAMFWHAVRLLNLSGPGVERWLADYEGYDRRLSVLSVYAFWLLAALAVVGVATRRARRVPRAVWALPVLIALSNLFTEGLTRYRAPADPFLVMLAAVGILAMSSRLRGSEASPRPT